MEIVIGIVIIILVLVILFKVWMIPFKIAKDCNSPYANHIQWISIIAIFFWPLWIAGLAWALFERRHMNQ
ncbi:hypothetical protein [Endozoicomonas sp. ALB032]|uniref:hypothetical protein n=1 Tax=Endozoicomonas sp. ALB032 TaxID=3403082 RepID=UPI003BB59150